MSARFATNSSPEERRGVTNKHYYIITVLHPMLALLRVNPLKLTDTTNVGPFVSLGSYLS